MHTFLDLSKGAKILLALCSAVVLAEGAYLYYIQTNMLTKSASTCQYVVSQWEKASPETAAAKEVYTGVIAEVKFGNERFPEADEFKSVISETVAKGTNFAGHYAMAEWGCGTNCQDHAIVDVKTGEIVAFGIPSEAGLSFNAGSSLIMTNPQSNFPTTEKLASSSFIDKLYWFNVPREYYVLADERGISSLSRLCIENAYDGQVF